jgi:hypothetical protein
MMPLTLAAPMSVILLAAALWLGAAWLCWENWRRSANRRASGQLESLRFVLISLLVFTLLRPEYVQKVVRTGQPEVALLLDRSGSMATRDLTVSNRPASRAEWLNAREQNQFWKPLERVARVSLEPFSATASTPRNDLQAGTDLGGALESALNRHKNLKAILLISDGDWNMGKSPQGVATRCREEGIPIYTVAAGRTTPVPDLELGGVNAPAYGLYGEQIAIPFKVTSHLPREVKTAVTLTDSKGEAARREITIPANGEVEDAILWSPGTVGEMTGLLKLPVQPDEALADNNERSFHISIRLEKIKVLVVDTLPRWEYRYLRNALARDPGVEMRCLLLHPDLGPGDGVNYIQSFPSTKEAIASYDVIFLGDIGLGAGELTARDAELIRGLVEQQASGLVFVPGRRGREMSLMQSALGDLMPVILDAQHPEGIPLQNESILSLTQAGRRHLLTRFDADESRNDELWKQLPGFFWSAAVEKSRPGSEVLAVHSGLRNTWGRIPLLVTRQAGSGKVLFLGTDSAWRWRRGVEDKYHYRFWGQVVRWMAHQRHLSEKDGIRLSYTPETPQTGDTVALQTTVLDASGFPIESGSVTARITAPSGRVETADFTPLPGGWGVFKAHFNAMENGRYKLDIVAPQHSRRLETELLVAKALIEKIGQPINSATLQEIADITHGTAHAAEDLGQAIDQVTLLPERQPVEKRIRLWAEPFWGGLILLLLCVYWVGRKLAGMI